MAKQPGFYKGATVQEHIEQLHKLGYKKDLIYKDDRILHPQKDLVFLPESLFFVDGGYRIFHTYLFAISAPKYDLKAILAPDLQQYHTLGTSPYAAKFDLAVENMPETIIIRRQYGMRKIAKEEFDPDRYVLRKGFEDFPSCPYGEHFKALGYDMQKQCYVRLAPAILKDERLKIIEKR